MAPVNTTIASVMVKGLCINMVCFNHHGRITAFAIDVYEWPVFDILKCARSGLKIQWQRSCNMFLSRPTVRCSDRERFSSRGLENLE